MDPEEDQDLLTQHMKSHMHDDYEMEHIQKSSNHNRKHHNREHGEGRSNFSHTSLNHQGFLSQRTESCQSGLNNSGNIGRSPGRAPSFGQFADQFDAMNVNGGPRNNSYGTLNSQRSQRGFQEPNLHNHFGTLQSSHNRHSSEHPRNPTTRESQLQFHENERRRLAQTRV